MKSLRKIIFPLLLIVFSTATHFAFFGWPSQVVFDEVYNGGFVGNYSTGKFYFDVHPPLAKILEKFFGDFVHASYNVDFSSIGNTLPWGVVLLRLLPLIAGLLLPLVVYYLCLHINFSKLGAFTAGALIILENSLLVHSRFILFDSIMILFGFAALLLYFIYIKRGGYYWVIGSALLCAGAFSIKWTGMAFPLIILIAEIIRTKKAASVVRCAAIYCVVGLFAYLAVFAVHFAYLGKSGPGDAFMTDRFQKTLDGSMYSGNAAIQPKGFFGKFIELNIEMLHANNTLTATHSYSSRWYTWPLMIRGIFYWQGTPDVAGGGNSYIYLLGNPFIYWLGTVAVIFLLTEALRLRGKDKTLLFIVIGFLVNFIPFIFIGRVMFLYHYEAALVFSIIALAYVFEKYVPEKNKKLAVGIFLATCCVSFLFFSPLTYGLHLSDAALHARMWLPSWR